MIQKAVRSQREAQLGVLLRDVKTAQRAHRRLFHLPVGAERKKVMCSHQSGRTGAHGAAVQRTRVTGAVAPGKHIRPVAVPETVDIGLLDGRKAGVEALRRIVERQRTDILRQKAAQLRQHLVRWPLRRMERRNLTGRMHPGIRAAAAADLERLAEDLAKGRFHAGLHGFGGRRQTLPAAIARAVIGKRQSVILQSSSITSRCVSAEKRKLPSAA